MPDNPAARPPNRHLPWPLELPFRRPRLVVLVAGLVTAVLAFYAPQVRVDGSIDTLLARGDPERAYHEEVKRVFGSDEVTRIGIFADDVFTPATLAKIDRLSREIRRLDGVRKVVSLATVRTVEQTERGLRSGRLMPRPPETVREAGAFRPRVMANQLLLGSIVSRDGRATALDVFYEPMSDRELTERGLESRVRAAVASLGGPESSAISGIPTLKAEGARRMEEDIRTCTVLALLVVIVVLAFTFGNARGVVLPLVAVGMGIAWTNGVMALLDRPITIGSLVLNPLLMAIGVAYAIHVVSRTIQESRPGLDVHAVIRESVRRVALPVSTASVTTVLGFATLIPHPVATIHDLGLWSVFGITVIFVASLSVIPAILVLLPPPRASDGGRRGIRSLTGLLGAVADTVARHPRAVVVAGILVCAPSVPGIARLRIETDYLGFFERDSRVRIDTERIAEELSGTHPLQVVVEGDGPHSLTRPGALAALRRLQNFLDGEAGVEKTISVLDSLALVRDAIEPGGGERLPATHAEAEQLLVHIDPREIENVIARDASRANVVVYTRLSGSREIDRFVERIEEFARGNLPPALRVHPTGTIVLLNRTSDTIARQQVAGLGQMIAVLFVVMAAVFRSLRVGFLSLIPNVVPIALLFGLMGWMDVSLNVSTSMIAVIAIGIAVDDTIHYLTEFDSERRRPGGRLAATARSIRNVGRPIVFTSVALAAGFLVSCVSGFQPVRQFGALSAATMIFALLADLVVTPAIAMIGGARARVAREVPDARRAETAKALAKTGGMYG